MYNLIYFLAFVIIVIVSAMAYFMNQKRKTAEELHLELKMRPAEVIKGERVKLTVEMLPDKESQVEFINGSIFCRRYEDYKGNWQDYTELPFFANGQNVARIDFEFGKEMVLEAGKEASLGGKVIIPDDAMPTEIKGIIQVHWFVIVRVKLKNLPVAEITEELIVLPPKVFDGAGEEVDLGELYDPTYDLRKQEEEQEKVADFADARKAMTERKKQQEELRKDHTPEPKPVVEEREKVTYHAPFDPTKTAQAQAAADAIVAEGIAFDKDDERYKPRFRDPVDPTQAGRPQAPVSKPVEEKEEAIPDAFERPKPTFRPPFDPTKTVQAQTAAGKIAEEKEEAIPEVFERPKPKFHAPFDPTKTPQAQAAAGKLAEERGEAIPEVFERPKPTFHAPFDPTKTPQAQAAAGKLAEERGEAPPQAFERPKPTFHAPFDPTKTPQAQAAAGKLAEERGEAPPQAFERPKPTFQAPFDPTKTPQAQAASGKLAEERGAAAPKSTEKAKPTFQAPFDPTKTPQAQAALAKLGAEAAAPPPAPSEPAALTPDDFEAFLYGESTGPSFAYSPPPAPVAPAVPAVEASTPAVEASEPIAQTAPSATVTPAASAPADASAISGEEGETEEIQKPSEEEYHKKHFVPTRTHKTKLKVKSLTGDDESEEGATTLKRRIGEEEPEEDQTSGKSKFGGKLKSLKALKAASSDEGEQSEEDDGKKKFKKKLISRKQKS